MEGCGFGDGDGDQVTGPGRLGAFGNREVHQPLVPGPAGEPVGFFSLPPGLGSDHDLHPPAQLLGVFFGGNPVLQGGQAFEALLDYGLGQLIRAGPPRGCPAAWSTGT